jgi:predicted DNA-binding protein (UPF0278 family)
MTNRLGDNACIKVVRGLEDMADERRNLSQINAYVPTEIKQEFKLECLKAGKTMSDVIEELVADWLKKRPKDKK